MLRAHQQPSRVCAGAPTPAAASGPAAARQPRLRPQILAGWAFALSLALSIALGGCSGQRVTVPAAAGQPDIPIVVTKPDGEGPFPGIVLLHACNGFNTRVVHAWTRQLVAAGYIVAAPDSFTPRGYPKGVCGSGTEVPPELRARDAYAALKVLEQRPDVRADRIGMIGFSHGGWTVVVAMNALRSSGFKPPGLLHDFAAAIAMYPYCPDEFAQRGTYAPSAPLLILAGALDYWTPSPPCEALAERSQNAGFPVTIKVYPDGHHSFDAPIPLTFIPEARRGRGAYVGGSPLAREDSGRRVLDYFAATLKK